MPIESSLRAFSIKEARYEKFSYEITDVIPFSLGTLGSNAIDDCVAGITRTISVHRSRPRRWIRTWRSSIV